ncbi:MAG TPA: CRISPR-associated endonuclease Cas2 [Phycisphaerae bacterium]|nr:CRISPR-associated endonuclease Cas2 [Phycisphaerae bacterium]
MFVLVTYDVSTTSKVGRKRLSRVARICANFGQRAQNSVFECQVDPAQYAELRHQLTQIIDEKEDSIRFYHLGSNWRRRVEHFGLNKPHDLDDLLLF